MKPVERSEILPLGEYEAIRERFRARVIGEKKARRLQLGPRATCVFENHDTVLLQIQEMLRTERITRDSAIQHEIETYNELIPPAGGLSVTVMIEIDDKAERDAFLVEARGLEAKVALVAGGERAPAAWDKAREQPDRLSAVLHLKFPLGPAARRAIEDGEGPVAIEIEHAAYRARAELPPPMIQSLAEDLR
jgi:hypothetical protein